MIRLLLCLILFALPVRAEMPAGHDDPRFQAAVAAWLDADDQGSLPALAVLAQDGNTAAQILLGRVKGKEAFHLYWFKQNERDRFRSIFRAPADPKANPSRFGRSWMEVAAETSELAQAFRIWFSGYSPETVATMIRRLSALGEDRALILPVHLIGSQNTEALVPLATDGVLPRYLRVYGWKGAFKSGTPIPDLLHKQMLEVIDSTDVEDLVLKDLLPHSSLHPTGIDGYEYQQPQTPADCTAAVQAKWFSYGSQSWIDGWVGDQCDVSRKDRHPDTLVRELMQIPALAQIAQTCKSLCPSEVLSCVRAAHSFVDGYYGMMFLGTPTETLIPQEIYTQSARARDEVLYKIIRKAIVFGEDTPGALVSLVFEQSPCLAGHVATMQSELEQGTK